MTKHPDVNQARAFMDLLSEEIMSLSDEEILARAQEEGVDVDRNLKAFQARFGSRADATKRVRLTEARKTLENRVAKVATSLANLSLEEMKTRFGELVASGLIDRDSRLSLSFRSGKDIDEDDLRSALEDYEELKNLQDRDEPDVR